ncbi:MAG: hypothetical protein JKY37_02015 [Nannocystaceae bacterium]|nr:hypothetical protein [Nannocystaceae bacterium]
MSDTPVVVTCGHMQSALFVAAAAISLMTSQSVEPSRVVVLPTEVTGDAPSTVAAAFGEAAEAGVGKTGADAVGAAEGCTNGECAAEAAGAQGYVLHTTVEVVGSDYAITTRLSDASGKVVDEQSEPCEICNYEEAAEALQAMVEKAVAPIAVASAPPAPPVAPAPEPADESLDEAASTPRAGMSEKALGGIGFASLGVGIGALAGGVALLVLNERPVTSKCDGDQVDPQGDCELRYNTLGGGAGLAIGGAVGIGVGVGLLLLRRSRGQMGSGKLDVSASSGGLRVRF